MNFIAVSFNPINLWREDHQNPFCTEFQKQIYQICPDFGWIRSQQIDDTQNSSTTLTLLWIDTTRLKNARPDAIMKQLSLALNHNKHTPPHTLGADQDLLTALVLARQGVHTRNEPDYVLTLSTEFLVFLSMVLFPTLISDTEQMVERLHDLGVHHIREFMSFSVFELTSRFGACADLLTQTVQAMLENSTRQNYSWPRARLDSQIKYEQGFLEHETCSDLDSLLFALTPLLSRCISATKERGLAITKIQITFNQKYSFEYSFYFPQHTLLGIRPLITEKLSRTVLSFIPVDHICVAVSESIPNQLSHPDFFVQHQESQESFESLVTRLHQKTDQSRVFLAKLTESYLPEHSWRRVQPKWLPVTSAAHEPLPLGPRPLRLLEKPLELSRVGRYLMTSTKRYTIRSVHELDRIHDNWTQTVQTLRRDYYRICVAEPSEPDLWIFRSDDRIFLHGFYG